MILSYIFSLINPTMSSIGATLNQRSNTEAQRKLTCKQAYIMEEIKAIWYFMLMRIENKYNSVYLDCNGYYS